LPAEHFAAAMAEIEQVIDRGRFAVNFPVECRFVKGDDIWLSPAYQRDSAYIAVHMYRGMPYRAYFDAIEAVFQRYEGRPHWGKMHTLTAATLATRYPRWNEFLRVRASLDPQGVFLNGYLRRLFGVDGATGAP
jgi:FAD/FMN-containing dehydrogenase